MLNHARVKRLMWCIFCTLAYVAISVVNADVTQDKTPADAGGQTAENLKVADEKDSEEPGAGQEKVEPHLPQVTKFIQPLEDHEQALQKLLEKIEQLHAVGEPADEATASKQAEEIRKAGLSLLNEAKSFRKTVARFIGGQTRRGLDHEIELIRSCTQSVSEATVRFSRLPGVQPRDDKQIALDVIKDELVKEGKQWALKQVQARLTARFESEGVRDVINSNSLKEAKAKATDNIRKKLDEKLDETAERLTGLSFHDRRSARRALKLAINQGIEKQITKLVIRLGGGEMHVMIGKEVITRWLQDEFWEKVLPRIREQFRHKGSHEPRTDQSLASLEKARLSLMKLPNDANLDHVERAIRDTTATIEASAYLRGDLKRAGKDDLLKKLNEQIEHVERAQRITRARFLLHKEKIVLRLKGDVEVLDDAIAQLRELLKGQVPPETTLEHVYFYPQYQLPSETGAIAMPTPRTWTSGAVTVFTHVNYVDLDDWERTRTSLQKYDDPLGYLPLEDYHVKRSLAKTLKEDYIVKVTSGGKTAYVYHRMESPRSTGWGGFRQCGTTDGPASAELVLLTRSGMEMQTKVEWTVKLNDRVKDAGEAYQRTKQKLEKTRAAMKEPSGHEQALATIEHLRLLQSFAVKEAIAAGRPEDEVKKLIQEIYDCTPMLLQNTERPEVGQSTYVFYNCTVISWAASVGDEQLYNLACNAMANAEKYTTGEERSKIAGSYQYLAQMAIATRCDIPAARKHLESFVKYYKPVGSSWSEEQYRKTWPEVWE